MGILPIPAAMFFSDFSSDLLVYSVFHDSECIGSYKGLSNSDESGNYIGFLVSDNPEISVNDILRTPDGLESFTAKKISYDRYNRKAELMKVYY